MSPNEACYIDIEPIEANTLTPFNDSLARLRSISYKEKSKIINGKFFALWDSQIHEKLKYYQLSQLKEEGSEASGVIALQGEVGQGLVWKRITEMSMSPCVMKEKLQPSKVFAGEISNQSTICALIAMINHDIKFSTNYIG